MKFEVVNQDGKTVMQTNYIECIPDKEIINSMIKNKYKFRIDDKVATIKKINEYIKDMF